MSTTFAKYINNWLNEANKEPDCSITLWLDGVIAYRPLYWEEGVIHLCRKFNDNAELIINTKEIGFIRFEKEYK